MAEDPVSAGKPAWRAVTARYERPHLLCSLRQLADTLIPFFLLLTLMYRSLAISYGLTLVLAVPAALFYVRLFVLFHDCTHRSFFRSPAANAVIGSLLGILTATPYFHWRTTHLAHHGSSGNLNRRTTADVWTLTVREYLSSPPLIRLAYRAYRHPITLFGVGPLFKWVIKDRIPTERGKRERWSVHGTNLALAGIFLTAHLTIGLKTFFLMTLPAFILATSFGIWLFYVQHNFEDTYWEQEGIWDYATAALHGSSFYRLPRALQWFTADIGYHHVHHLSPRIPNYRLQACHEENTLFRSVPALTLPASLRCLAYRLWDEDGKQLVDWNYLKTYADQ